MVTAELIETLELKDPEALLRFPWPYDDESVREITCLNVFEFIPGRDRGRFMDEIYRILVPEGTLKIACLHWNNAIAYHDYRIQWPPVAEQSFLIFNRDWREKNNKTVDLKCNFDFTYGYNYEPDIALRSAETQAFQGRHYANTAHDVQLVMK